MVVFDGIFEWDGKKRSAAPPISWWPGSYRLKIVDLRDRMPGVAVIKPYVCILCDTGNGFNIKNTFEKFALNVCEHFGLDVSKVLWVEDAPANPDEAAAVVQPIRYMGKNPVYETTWRPIRPNEQDLVASCVQEH